MIEKIKSSWSLINNSIKVFKKYPKFLIPILMTWCIYAPTILYVEYLSNYKKLTFLQQIPIAFVIILLFAFILTISCSVLLELIQQLESNKTPNLKSAFKDTFKQNFINMIPLVIVWAIMWLLISIVQALVVREKQGSTDNTFSVENAAKTLAGYDGYFSPSKAFFEAIRKGVRMIMFLILPAIAWENKNFNDAFSKGITMFENNISYFLSGFVMLEGVAYIIFFPIGLVFGIAEGMELAPNHILWLISIFFLTFAWSFSIYLEQMFTAELYLWNLKWEKKVIEAKKDNQSIPLLSDISKPSLLDNEFEFIAKVPLKQ